MSLHCMVDLETLDTDLTATVLTIGAVAFDPRHTNGFFDLPDHIHIKIRMEDQTDRTISPATLRWWLDQNKVTRDDTFSLADAVPLEEAKYRFFSFLNCNHIEALWGNGSLFDNAILLNLWPDLPLKYWQHRDLRTLKDTATILLGDAACFVRHPAAMIKHNALHDATFQAMQVQHYMSLLT